MFYNPMPPVRRRPPQLMQIARLSPFREPHSPQRTVSSSSARRLFVVFFAEAEVFGFLILKPQASQKAGFGCGTGDWQVGQLEY